MIPEDRVATEEAEASVVSAVTPVPSASVEIRLW